MNRNDLRIERKASSKNSMLSRFTKGGALSIMQEKQSRAMVSSKRYHHASAPMRIQLSDSDGIHSTIWNMTFFNPQRMRSIRLKSSVEGLHSPVDWSFEDALNSGQCEDPGVPLPSGTFDVRIRPYLRIHNVQSRWLHRYRSITYPR